MIPLVGAPQELELQRDVVDRTAQAVFAEEGMTVPYLVGTMIELPRAALLADQIAQYADFLSFGTNDLTQTTLGMSRDDAGRFLPAYVRQGILPRDPFVSLDVEGVGQLIAHGDAARSHDAAGPQGGRLWRAWGRPGQHRVLCRGRARLRQLLALPGADRAPRRCPRQPGRGQRTREAPSRATASDQWTLCYTASTWEGEACRLIPDPRVWPNTER